MEKPERGVLVVMDAQNYWADKNPRTTQRIKDSLTSLRQRGLQIVWVYAQENPDDNHVFTPLPPQQVGDKKVKDLFNGHASFLYDPAIPPAPADWVVGKGPNQTDAFTNPHVEEFLKRQGNVYVAGYMRGFCAYDTAVSSKKAGLPTTFVEDLSADKNDAIDPDGGDFKKAGVTVGNAADLFGYRFAANILDTQKVVQKRQPRIGPSFSM
jgi:nicotinamidase-related amidase